MQYVAGATDSDGQAYAAAPDGTNYFVILDTAAVYPRAGFGNGLEQFTYSAWIKTQEGQFGTILGVQNVDTNTSIEFRVMDDGSIRVFLRPDGGGSITSQSAAGLVWDDQWHWFTATYDGANVRVFLDGEERAAAGRPAPLTTFGAWQYPMTLLARNNRGVVDTLFTGQADDLKIFNYPMTREQVAMTYHTATGKPVCLERPQYDFNRDCSVSLADFAIMAQEWLWTGLYPEL
jgi:hypothetical protein